MITVKALICSAFLLFGSEAEAYPATLFGKYDGKILVVTAYSKVPVSCQMRVEPDSVWMEFKGKSPKFQLPVGYRMNDISLYCKVIDKISQAEPWRKNRFKGRFPERLKRFIRIG